MDADIDYGPGIQIDTEIAVALDNGIAAYMHHIVLDVGVDSQIDVTMDADIDLRDGTQVDTQIVAAHDIGVAIPVCYNIRIVKVNTPISTPIAVQIAIQITIQVDIVWILEKYEHTVTRTSILRKSFIWRHPFNGKLMKSNMFPRPPRITLCYCVTHHLFIGKACFLSGVTSRFGPS